MSIGISLTALALGAAASTPLQLLEEVHTTYLEAGDIEAAFTQTYVGGLRGTTKVETGRIWAKQDGRLRWQYEKPEPKYFVFDGTNAYYYEPLNSQVWVYKGFKDTQLATALRLLMGRGNLPAHFDVAPCKKHCGLGQKGEVVLELTPKEPMANIEHVAVVIDPRSKRVLLSAMFDSLGYRTEYRFTDVRFKADIDERKLRFTTPPGVQELDATQMGEGGPGR